MRRVVLWDFDGTLAHRDGMWSGCLVDALEDVLPAHGIDAEAFRPHLRDGFPWHAPEVVHPELCEADAWWANVGALLARAYRAAGVAEQHAAAAARLRRSHPLVAPVRRPRACRELRRGRQLRADGLREAAPGGVCGRAASRR